MELPGFLRSKAGAVAAAVLALCAAAAIPATRWATGGKVWVANGLEQEVRVTLGGQLHPVPAGSHVSFRMPSGTYEVVAETADGKGREAETLAVPRFGGDVVYNVAGAAPLFWVRTHYAKDGHAPDAQVDPRCGPRTFEVSVSFMFQEPPDSVSISRGASTATRTSLQQLGDHWGACLGSLQSAGRFREAIEVAERVAALQPQLLYPTLAAAESRWLSGDREGTLRSLWEQVWWPGEHALHHAYQHYGLLAGERQRLISQYADWMRIDPSPDRRALHARVLYPAARLQAYGELLAADPGSASARRGLAWALLSLGRAREALPHLQRLLQAEGLPPQAEDRHHQLELQALVAAGKMEEAIQALSGWRPKRPVELSTVVARGLLARKAGRPDLAPGQAEIGNGPGGRRDPRRVALYWAQVAPEEKDRGSRIEDPGFLAMLGVLQSSVQAPERAVKKAAAMSKLEMLRSGMPVAQAYLLLGEAWRMGDRQAAAVLELAAAKDAAEVNALRAFVLDGMPTGELSGLELDSQAALSLARARQLREEGRGREALAMEAQARARDVLAGPVTRALEQWRKPDQAAVPVAAAAAVPAKKRKPRVEHHLVRDDSIALEREP